MKKIHLKNKNKTIFIIILIIFGLSFVFGIYRYINNPSDVVETQTLFSSLKELNETMELSMNQIYLKTMVSNLFWLFLIMIFSMYPWLMPLSFVCVFYMGYTLAISIASVFHSLGFGGIIPGMIGLFIPRMIIVIGYVFVLTYTIGLMFERKGKNAIFENKAALVFMGLYLLVGGFLQSYAQYFVFVK